MIIFILLKVIKNKINNKNFRYFFKCEDPDLTAVQEEITEDCAVLPLWEGKVKAAVKALE